ncbi:hypothetical protein M433DRAFT_150240 [Acidomyces richmondensis BFW]|nr:MAG: hypothetical protein FE78DRAFT_94220 [Acidomyces sp. 'richmondensis']KYG49181.1 hypothetical protein M433DRAFT_150240 [Acidomyces richmondensis BFW]
MINQQAEAFVTLADGSVDTALNLNNGSDRNFVSQISSLGEVNQPGICTVYKQSGPFQRQVTDAASQVQAFDGNGTEFGLTGDCDPLAIHTTTNPVIAGSHARTFSQNSFDSTNPVEISANDFLEFVNMNFAGSVVPLDSHGVIPMASPFDHTVDPTLLEPELFNPNLNLEAHLGLGATVQLQP